MGNKTQIETVDVSLTVKIPKQYHEFLRKLGALVDRTVEELLTEEVYGLLRSFMRGGGVETWTEHAIYMNEDLEQLAAQVEAQVCP